MQDFESFFEQATGRRPYGYQARIARDGLPDLLRVPTGAGKTGVILAWLWRRLHGQDPAGTPRRLVYALPQRSLVEPVSGSIQMWLGNLGLAHEVAVHVVLGSRSDGGGDWRENMHQPAIVVGDADLLVSKALTRGYGTGSAIYPMDFAFVCNGAQWIIDEIQLCPQATTTLRQLAGLARMLGTAEPFGLTCMTATAGSGGLLATVDNPSVGQTVELAPGERPGDLAVRLGAGRTIRRAAVNPGDYQALARFVLASHRAGELTLVTLHGVPAAQEVYRLVLDGPVPCALLHSQFRGVERAARLADVMACSSDLIVVSAGETASGLDLTAAVVVTEAAPWASIVRRIGRANPSAAMKEAKVWWLPSPAPYEASAVDAACAELSRLEGVSVTGEDLLTCSVPSARDQVAVIGRADLSVLFDTSPTLSGIDPGIDRYVRDGGDPDVEIAWAQWTPREDGAPDPEVRFPAPGYRCRVSVTEAVSLAEDLPVWRFDPGAVEWRRITRQSSLRPYDLLLVAAADGGYDQETGFDPMVRTRVPDSPEVLTPAELTERAALAARAAAEAGEPAPALAPRRWQSLNEHSEQVRDQAAALLAVLAPSISPEAARAAVVAGYLHDVGKAYPTWQDALCALAVEPEADAIAAGRPWAKSGTSGALEFSGGVSFRHEFASLLLVDGPLRALLAESPDPDLTRYLVLAHHGLLRVQVRDTDDLAVLPHSVVPGAAILGLKQGTTSDIPPMLGQPATTLTVDLDQFHPGGERSWTRTVLTLLDKYGPFTLAFLETVVRVADWRASGGRELPGLVGEFSERTPSMSPLKPSS